MFENEEDFIEENINKKKNKKVSKHFEILMNGRKTKILNFLIKDYKHLDRTGKIIQLISKFNITLSQRNNVKLEISKDGEMIEIVGDWCVEWYGVGQHYIVYWINEMKVKQTTTANTRL